MLAQDPGAIIILLLYCLPLIASITLFVAILMCTARLGSIADDVRALRRMVRHTLYPPAPPPPKTRYRATDPEGRSVVVEADDEAAAYAAARETLEEIASIKREK